MPVLVKGKYDVKNWTTADFISYYMKKYKELRNDPMYKFPDTAWLLYGVHIKRFMTKLKLTNEDYRDFIDWVFSPVFLGKRNNVGFMAIVKYEVWYYYQRMKNQQNPHIVNRPKYGELQKMRNIIDANKDIFPDDYTK
jgi:hypothetical protein